MLSVKGYMDFYKAFNIYDGKTTQKYQPHKNR